MKKILIIALLLFFVKTVSAQTFYVEKTSDGFEQPIIDKLVELNKKITTKQDSSDYTIKCIIQKAAKFSAEGNIEIYETKTGNALQKSKLVKGRTTAFNGYASPKKIVMNIIAKDYLYDLLFEVEKTKK
ncbi:MAG TPA: hypothetical protein PKK00_09465 [Bacteroidales bacterium]|nr:hypothetical protein [Bacteroidales bacterium]HPS17455.1 hypothetical protein [Bacteroidales bacterium]